MKLPIKFVPCGHFHSWHEDANGKRVSMKEINALLAAKEEELARLAKSHHQWIKRYGATMNEKESVECERDEARRERDSYRASYESIRASFLAIIEDHDIDSAAKTTSGCDLTGDTNRWRRERDEAVDKLRAVLNGGAFERLLAKEFLAHLDATSLENEG